MKYRIFLNGELHSEPEQPPADILGDELRVFDDYGNPLRLTVFYDLSHQFFDWGCVEYHYMMRCAHKLVETMQ